MSQALFLTHTSPFPPRGSHQFRDFHVLKLLCEQFREVEIICLSTPLTSESETLVCPTNVTVSQIEREKLNLFRKVLNPRRKFDFSDSIEKLLRSRAEPGKLLWISRLLMGNCATLARRLGYRVVLDEHIIDSKKLPHYWSAAQAVVAASNIDATRLSKLAPSAPVHIIPNTVDHCWFEPARASEGSTLFFSGSLNHPTNIEGLQWFMAEILPRLRARLGEKLPRVVVAGANPSSELESQLGKSGIEVHANPPSMLPFFAEAAIVFVPIRSGGGSPLKILEAMAAGRAVVSTGKATEGLVLAPTFDILTADHADSFTSDILRLLANPELRKQLGAHAAETVLNRYDWRCARSVMEEILKSVQVV